MLTEAILFVLTQRLCCSYLTESKWFRCLIKKLFFFQQHNCELCTSFRQRRNYSDLICWLKQSSKSDLKCCSPAALCPCRAGRRECIFLLAWFPIVGGDDFISVFVFVFFPQSHIHANDWIFLSGHEYTAGDMWTLAKFRFTADVVHHQWNRERKWRDSTMWTFNTGSWKLYHTSCKMNNDFGSDDLFNS